MYWASRISSIGFQMAVPPLAGWWGDNRWGTAPWLLIVGAVFGFGSGMLAIFKLADSFGKPGGSSLPNDQQRSQDGLR
jgi:F0F1-type ATP synthase assembly protein I